MTDLRLTVLPPDGNAQPVEVAPEMRTDDFLRELLGGLRLPTNDNNGPISWRIDNKNTGKTLDQTKTLKENGVEDGHRLTLVRITIAAAM